MNIPNLASRLLFLFLQSRNLSLPVHTASSASTAAPRSSAPVWGRPVASCAAAAGPVALGTSLRSDTKLLNFLNKWRHYTIGI